jgi:hypothetical protein
VTSHQRYARAFTLAALLTAAGAIGCYSDPIPTAGLAYGAAVLAWCASREYGAHRRVLEEREWARRRALGEQPAPLTPCCLWAAASDGAAHDPRRCTRTQPPPAPLEDALADLGRACCERWWTALETDHDPTCPNQQPRSNAA